MPILFLALVKIFTNRPGAPLVKNLSIKFKNNS